MIIAIAREISLVHLVSDGKPGKNIGSGTTFRIQLKMLSEIKSAMDF